MLLSKKKEDDRLLYPSICIKLECHLFLFYASDMFLLSLKYKYYIYTLYWASSNRKFININKKKKICKRFSFFFSYCTFFVITNVYDKDWSLYKDIMVVWCITPGNMTIWIWKIAWHEKICISLNIIFFLGMTYRVSILFYISIYIIDLSCWFYWSLISSQNSSHILSLIRCL